MVPAAVALAGHAAEGAPGGHIAVMAAFDHEEIGSATRSGASGPFLQEVLERVSASLGADAADRAQEQFQEERSDFLAYLKLWSFFEDAIKHKKSNRKLIDLLHEHFLSHRRMREWRDIHSQLHTVVAEHGTPTRDLAGQFLPGAGYRATS